MKLKQKILALGAGVGLSLPAMSVLAAGSCQRCEEAWTHCQLVLGMTYQQCWYYTGGCIPC